MSRARVTVRAAVTAALAGALLAGCAAAPMPTPTPTPSATPTGDGVLRIGTLFPMTGPLAFLGPAQVAGVNAALREINAAGGVNGAPVEVVNRDSGDASTKKAEESFAALVERGVDVVIGPSSSAIAERLLGPAAEAGVPLISPAATYPWLSTRDDAGVFFRTIPHYGHQGAVLAALLTGQRVRSVAVVYLDTGLGRSLLASLETGLAGSDVELTAVKIVPTTPAADVAEVVKGADPAAVVLATPDNGDQTKALIRALTDAGYGHAKLTAPSQNLADYSQALPGGLLENVNGVLEGAAPDDAFRAKIRREDPAVSEIRYAAEAYDATVLAALAAILAGDDGGPAIAAALQEASVGGIKCTSFGECVDVLATQPDIDYDGISGSANLDDAGDAVRGTYGVFAYNKENKPVRKTSMVG